MMEPYALSDDKVDLLAMNEGIDDVTEEYDPAVHKAQLRKIELAALWQLITLEREEDNGSTQTYDTDMIAKRIAALEEDDVTIVPQNEDITDWI